ncbi:MAG TPA: DUF2589 domain-containing protein [Nocardioidaceae bacterium]|nr:DUF2589 domain-containing protein [Nocardioidaceae bacterium]
MAESDLRSLPLHDLVSAPLTAAIEAQQQASLGVVDFIREVGFTRGKADGAQDVRMLEFRYAREGRDAEGRPVTRETRLRIPLLTMLPLPALEIERLTINVLVGLQSVSKTEAAPALDISDELRTRYPFLRERSSLRVAPTSRVSTKGVTQPTRPYDLEITLSATTEEPSDGMQRILTALDGLIVEEAE